MDDTIIIRGGNRLEGVIDLQGSKNSSLPILAATVLVDGISMIHNCPELTDVTAAVKILEHLGCKVKREGSTLIVDSRFINRSFSEACHSSDSEPYWRGREILFSKQQGERVDSTRPKG